MPRWNIRPWWVCATAITAASVGLIRHARLFDFTCDDAFITLRYARNFAILGAPVYNPGERVEGYTDFLWMVLTALGIRLGGDAVHVVKVLGALSGIGLLGAAWALWHRVEPKRLAGAVFVLAMLAMSAPVAAWTLGGLETPLFAALLTTAFALAGDVAAGTSLRRAVVLGIVLALATLTRPEGAFMFGVTTLVLIAYRVRDRHGRRELLAALLGYLAIVVPFVAWRWRYYGYPLPNTFYLKISGDRAQLLYRGRGYIAFAAQEIGYWLVAFIALALLVPNRRAIDGDDAERLLRLRRGAILWIARLVLPTFVVYVMFVGGDFLDLYRFFMPLFALAFTVVTAAGYRLAHIARGRTWSRVALLVAGVCVLAAHGVRQTRTSARALVTDEPERIARAIEPLGWTRLFALRWAAMGRWMGAHARPGEWMASGAAGATAFYSGLNNLDTLGLCDDYVAHHGDQLGDRPGHQRFAPRWYILQNHPVFVLVGDHIVSDMPEHFERDPSWSNDGYEWVEVRVDPRWGVPDEFYHRVLVRHDRLDALRSDPDVRFAE